jgi:hypothetical protein
MKSFVKTASFSAAASASEFIDTEDAIVAALYMGAVWQSNAPLTFLAAADKSSTYRSLLTDYGVEAVCVSMNTNKAISIVGTTAEALAPWRYIKLQSGYAASVIPQVNATSIAVVLKRA